LRILQACRFSVRSHYGPARGTEQLALVIFAPLRFQQSLSPEAFKTLSSFFCCSRFTKLFCVNNSRWLRIAEILIGFYSHPCLFGSEAGLPEKKMIDGRTEEQIAARKIHTTITTLKRQIKKTYSGDSESIVLCMYLLDMLLIESDPDAIEKANDN
jgi:hypothetical protein